MTETKPKLLIAEDGENIVRQLEAFFGKQFTLAIAFSSSPAEVVAQVTQHLESGSRPEVAIVDGLEGRYREVVRLAQAAGVPHIFIHSGTDLSEEAARLGVQFLIKGAASNLRSVIAEALNPSTK